MPQSDTSGLPDDAGQTIAVCIPTCRRPELLGETLDSVLAQQIGLEPSPKVVVCVADNDPQGSARDAVDVRRSASPFEIKYEVEPQSGLTFIRNRLVAMAKDVDFIAFIDDDERADVDWLQQLIKTQRETKADAVRGPVVAEYISEPSAWMEPLLRDKKQRTTGTPIERIHTNNLLVSMDALQKIEGPFHPAFNFTGAEDWFLGELMLLNGAKFVWCQDAVVRETISDERTTLSWTMRRRYREGTTSGHGAKLLPNPAKHLLIRGAKGVAGVSLSVVCFLPSVLRGRTGVASCLCRFSKGMGSIAGLFGGTYEEYKGR